MREQFTISGLGLMPFGFLASVLLLGVSLGAMDDL